MSVEQKRRVLDEHAVRVIGQVGEADYLEAGLRQRALIGVVLSGRFSHVDRNAAQMRELAFE